MAATRRLSALALLATVVEDLRQFASLPPGLAGRILGWILFLAPSLAVTARLAAYEARIDSQGLAAASLALLRQYYRGTDSDGVRAPEKGPLLVIANHPGLGDAMALLSWIRRRDMVVVTNDRPFFRIMPALRSHTIRIARGSAVSAIRRMTDALAGGRCLVLFPAGRIEPDPASDPQPLAEWPELAATLVRAARRRGLDLAVLPVLISGVLARGVHDSLLVRSARRGRGRDRAAALYTFLLRASRGQRVRLRAGALLRAAALPSGDRGEITRVLRARLLAAGDRS